MYPTTLADLTSDIFTRLNESESSPAFFTSTDVLRSINEGMQDLSEITGWDEIAVDVQFKEGRTYYDLRTVLQGSDFYYNHRFLWPTRAFNFQTQRWLVPVVVRDLDYYTYRRWETVTGNGEPEKFFLRGMWWLGLFPKPNYDYLPAQDRGKIVLYFRAAPAYMASTDSLPTALLEEAKPAIVAYAMADLQAQQAEVEKANLWWGQYEVAAEAFRRYVNQLPQMNSVRTWGSNT